MPDLHVVIMAGGKGTRMKSAYPKVLHRLRGLPLIEYVLRAAEPLAAQSTVVVVGHMAEAVRGALAGRAGLQFATQEPQLGTAHAVMQAEPLLAGKAGIMALLSGDVPRLSTETLRRMITVHTETGAAATLLTAVLDDPYGYGSSGREVGSSGLSKRGTQRRRSGAFRRSTPGSTSSISSRSFRR
jgi:bifunctional UDP-N-acetylglucosamine pyrophosphorylase/glucosamine-1-phosphate N-acetyltransferase